MNNLTPEQKKDWKAAVKAEAWLAIEPELLEEYILWQKKVARKMENEGDTKSMSEIKDSIITNQALLISKLKSN